MIERQRVLESKKNAPTVRKLVEDLRDTEDGIRKTYRGLAAQKKKKRQLKRRLVMLTDTTPVVTTDKTILKKSSSISAMPCRSHSRNLTARDSPN